MSSTRLLKALLLGSTLVGFDTAHASAQQAADPDRLLDPAYVASQVCRPTPKQPTELYKPGFQLALARDQTAAAWAKPPLYDNLGRLAYEVSTRSPEAQNYFNQGLRLAYAFNHAEAARAFRAAQAADPTCAMCYWGEAYVLGPNINYPMGPEAVAPAFAAIAQAQALRGRADERERALLEAMAARYSADPAADRAALNTAYADEMARVAARWPEDDEIQVLFADALMNLQPWDYWEADRRTPKGRTSEQVEALERVLARSPDHPGAIHLYIHTVEASSSPERAEPHADRLGAQMPGAGHLVHMPAHIYFRVGRYLDSLRANLAAAAADEALFADAADQGIYRYGYYPHNVHFVLVSAQMAGDGANAVAAAEKLGKVMSDEIARRVGWVEAIKQAPYFAHATFSSPEVVLALPAPGSDFPFVRGSWHYARGIAALRAGDHEAAANERLALAELIERSDFARLEAWYVPAREVLTIARDVLDAQLARAGGDHARAERTLREAARIQATLPYMEPPFWYYPVKQTLAAVLLESGRSEDAIREFQASLQEAPNNAFALYGLMLAQEAARDAAAAKATRARFEQAWAGGVDLPILSRL